MNEVIEKYLGLSLNLYIDGKYTKSSSSSIFDVVDPATEIKIGEISLGILREVSPPNSQILKKELLEFKFVLVSNAPLNLKLKFSAPLNIFLFPNFKFNDVP